MKPNFPLIFFSFLVPLLVICVFSSSVSAEPLPPSLSTSSVSPNAFSITLSTRFPIVQATLVSSDDLVLAVTFFLETPPYYALVSRVTDRILPPSQYRVEVVEGNPRDFRPAGMYYPIAPSTYYKAGDTESVIQIDDSSQTVRLWVRRADGYRFCSSGDGEYVYCNGEYVEFRNETITATTIPLPPQIDYAYSWGGRHGIVCVRGATQICCTNIKQTPQEWSCASARRVWDHGNKIAVTDDEVYSADSGVIDIYRLPDLTYVGVISSPYEQYTEIAASDSMLYVYRPFTNTYVYDLLSTPPVTMSSIYAGSITGLLVTNGIIQLKAERTTIYSREINSWLSFPKRPMVGLLSGDTTFFGDEYGVWGYATDDGIKASLRIPVEAYYYYSGNNDKNAVYATRESTWEIFSTEGGIDARLISDTPIGDIIGVVDGYIYYGAYTVFVRKDDVVTAEITGTTSAAISGDYLWAYIYPNLLRKYSLAVPSSPVPVQETEVICLWGRGRLAPSSGGVLVSCPFYETVFVDRDGVVKWRVPLSYVRANNHSMIGRDVRDRKYLVDISTGNMQSMEIAGGISHCNDKEMLGVDGLMINVWRFVPQYQYKTFVPLVITSK